MWHTKDARLGRCGLIFFDSMEKTCSRSLVYVQHIENLLSLQAREEWNQEQFGYKCAFEPIYPGSSGEVSYEELNHLKSIKGQHKMFFKGGTSWALLC